MASEPTQVPPGPALTSRPPPRFRPLPAAHPGPRCVSGPCLPPTQTPTFKMLQRSERHSTSSQGRNMPRVTQLSMMTNMLTCSNHVGTGS